MSKSHLHTLDGLRGVAALAVVFFHLGLWTSVPWFFAHGYLAVDFFFCLSGFVIAYVYKQRFDEGLKFSEFVAQRMIRLYPVIAIGMILGLLFFAGFSFAARNQPYVLTDVIVAFAVNIFLIPFVGVKSVVGDSIYPLNSPFWSIFFEILINLAWAAGLRRVPAWLLFLVSSVLALVFFPLLHDLDIGGVWNQFWWGLLRVSVGFSAGLFIFDLYSRGYRLPSINAVWLLLGLGVLLAIPEWQNVWLDLLCVLFVFPVMTMLGVTAVSDGRLGRFMDLTGELSYPMYGVHRPVCLAFTIVILKLESGPAGIVLAIVGGFALAVVAGFAASRWLDQPFRDYLRLKYKAWRGAGKYRSVAAQAD